MTPRSAYQGSSRAPVKPIGPTSLNRGAKPVKLPLIA